MKTMKDSKCDRCGDVHLLVARCERYNGWSNYETWAVGLWIDNDEGLSDTVREMTEQIIKNPPKRSLIDRDMTAHELQIQLKNLIEEMGPDLGASLFSDLLNAAISQINWYELAEHYLDNARQEVA